MVSDDVVNIKKISNTLIGSSPETTNYRQRKMGYNAAEELCKRVNSKLK